MKLLGVDYGEKKTGLSLSSGNLAMPWQILCDLSTPELVNEIKSIIIEESVSKVVVGLPIGLNNKMTNQTEIVNGFINILKDQLSVPVESFDERYSSSQTKSQGVSGNDDAQAAANILQTYLDKFNSK